MDRRAKDSCIPEVGPGTEATSPDQKPCRLEEGQPERIEVGAEGEMHAHGLPPADAAGSGEEGKAIEAQLEAEPGQPGTAEQQPEVSPEALQETVRALTLERDEWKAKAQDFWDRYLRAVAEMENFRKRVERDIESRINRGKSELILPLLDVLDNFDRALAAGEKNAREDQDGAFRAFYDGVALIRRQILDVLAREGVEPIEDPVGKMFDPRYHEAVSAQEGGGEHGTIIQEYQRGYMYKGEVLRPSRVKVIR